MLPLVSSLSTFCFEISCIGTAVAKRTVAKITSNFIFHELLFQTDFLIRLQLVQEKYWMQNRIRTS